MGSIADRTESFKRPRRLGENQNRIWIKIQKGSCLACRALPIPCDTRGVCANCALEGKICCYLPDRTQNRTRERKTRKNGRTRTKCLPSVASDLSNRTVRWTWPVRSGRWERDPAWMEMWVDRLAGLCGPGVGLRNMDMPMVEIESIFDSIFTPAPVEALPDLADRKTSYSVQVYGSNEDILEAYYIFIHPYYPILPPPEHLPVSNRPVLENSLNEFEPSGPLALALAAILVLVPHPQENNPSRPEYVKARRELAHGFAQSASRAVEKDRPFRDVATQDLLGPHRKLFHSKVPLCLEGVAALSVLSVYEYAQRGNMNNMIQRANEAIQVAMAMNLHKAIDEDQFAEARQRVWWSTYTAVCQAFTVSGGRPTFDAFDPCFVTPYPKGWRLFIESQQALLEAVMFAKDLNEAIQSGADITWVPNRVAELDGQISSLLFDCRDGLPISQMAPASYSPEFTASKAMRSFAEIKLHSARVKIHRFYAFQDIPVLPKRPSKSDSTSSPDDSFRSFISSQIPDTPLSLPDSPFQSPRIHDLQFPFSVDTSSKICLHSTLNVVTLLDNLPYPTPQPERYSSQRSPRVIPRSMPTLVCCAMQASYAILMFCFKARMFQLNGVYGYGHSRGPDPANMSSLTSFRNELYQPLRLIGRCLSNYSIAFEALQGMRDEVARAIEREFTV